MKALCKKWRAGEITATAAMKELSLKPKHVLSQSKRNGAVISPHKATEKCGKSASHKFHFFNFRFIAVGTGSESKFPPCFLLLDKERKQFCSCFLSKRLILG